MNMFEYLLANDKDKSNMAKEELENFILERLTIGTLDKQSVDYILSLVDLI